MKNVFNDEKSSIKGSIAITIFAILVILTAIESYIENNPGKFTISNDGKKIEISMEYK